MRQFNTFVKHPPRKAHRHRRERVVLTKVWQHSARSIPFLRSFTHWINEKPSEKINFISKKSFPLDMAGLFPPINHKKASDGWILGLNPPAAWRCLVWRDYGRTRTLVKRWLSYCWCWSLESSPAFEVSFAERPTWMSRGTASTLSRRGQSRLPRWLRREGPWFRQTDRSIDSGNYPCGTRKLMRMLSSVPQTLAKFNYHLPIIPLSRPKMPWGNSVMRNKSSTATSSIVVLSVLRSIRDDLEREWKCHRKSWNSRFLNEH